VYFNTSVGAEQSNHLLGMKILTERLATAENCLTVLSKHFSNTETEQIND
jgi:hypothetical protein